MKLVEKHIIDKNSKIYQDVDNLCFLSKNLYNVALYTVRQYYFQTGNFLNYEKLQKQLQNNKQVDYYALPTKVSQQVLRTLCKNFKSFFNALQKYKTNPARFKSPPKLPKYKHKTKGRNIVPYPIDAISKRMLRSDQVKLSMSNIIISSKQKNIKQVRIIPRYGVHKIEIVYEKPIETRNVDRKNVAGIDIGLDNLVAITSNQKGFLSVLINGRPLKAINQYFNKKRAKLMSFIENKGTSRRIEKLTHKRNCIVDNYLHQSSRYIIDLLVKHNIGTLIIGKNDGWKQSINIGKRNNQKFVSIPHAKFIGQLQYKAEMKGIEVHLTEESYTSKCSFLDNESIKKHDKYLGKRVKRGLFKSKNGTKINADINGSANIIRKVIPNAFANGIEGIVVFPRRFTPFEVKKSQM